MNFFRQNIAPLIIVLVFVFALVAASARIFLPSDMSAPAPVGMIPSDPHVLSAVLSNWRSVI